MALEEEFVSDGHDQSSLRTAGYLLFELVRLLPGSVTLPAVCRRELPVSGKLHPACICWSGEDGPSCWGLVFSGLLCQTPVWAEERSQGCWWARGWIWESRSLGFGVLSSISCLKHLAPRTPQFLGFSPSLDTPSQALFWNFSLLPKGYV